MAVERRQQVAGADRPIDRRAAVPVGLADDLPHLQAATRQEHAPQRRPMVAATSRIDAGRAAEFSHTISRPSGMLPARSSR